MKKYLAASVPASEERMGTFTVFDTGASAKCVGVLFYIETI